MFAGSIVQRKAVLLIQAMQARSSDQPVINVDGMPEPEPQ